MDDILLMKYRPKAIDIVESALGSEKPLALLESGAASSFYRDVAKSFNQDRLNESIKIAVDHPEERPAVAGALADLFELSQRESFTREYSLRSKDQEILRLRAELERDKRELELKEQALDKQRRTNRYLRSQARNKKR